MPDKHLVQRTLRGEKEAFAELYDRYAPIIRASCYDVTGDLGTSQDLTQEVFLRAYGNLRSLRNQSSFASWILGIARLVCKEWKRESAKDRQQVDSGCYELPARSVSQAAASADLVYDAMASLPERERLALHVFYLQGRSACYARDVLKLSQSGFYKLLERARRKLAVAIGAQQEHY